MQSLYQLIYDSTFLRYLMYPLWKIGGKVGYFAAWFLLAMVSVYGAWFTYVVFGKFQFVRKLGKAKNLFRLIMAVLIAALIFLLLDGIPQIGAKVNHPSQILILAMVFWLVLLTTITILVKLHNRKNIIVSQGKGYKDHYVRGTVLVKEQTFNAKIKSEYNFTDNNECHKIKFGNVVIPPTVEDYHFSIAGTTGSGKSQTMFQILKVISARNENAIVFDIGGDFLKRFRRPNDKIFNPFHPDSVRWNPLLEIRKKRDCATLAEAITAVNESDVTGKRWADYNKSFLTAILEFMFEVGSTSIDQFLYYAFEADQSILKGVLAGTTAAAYVQDGNEEVFQSIRTTAVNKLDAWKYLSDINNNKPEFSIREWIKSQPSESIFIAVKDSDMASLREMISCFYALAFQEALDIPKFNTRLWFFLDELDTLGYIVSLRHGLTKLRKHAATIVLGFQAISQLRAIYGQHITDTLHINTRVQIAMTVTGDTAKYFSEIFGTQEVNRRQKNYSESTSGMLSSNNNSSTVANNIQRIVGKTLLDSDFSSLPNLTGYIRLIGLPEITRFKIPYSD